MGLVQLLPAGHAFRPYLRRFGQGIEPGAGIFSTFGVVGRGAGKRIRLTVTSRGHLGVEARQRESLRHRLGSHLVERQIHVLTEKQCILHRLRHQRPGQLLETGAEMRGSIAGLLRDFAGQNTHQQRDGVRIGADRGDHAVQQAHIRGRHPLRRAVGAVHREGHQQLAQCQPQRLLFHLDAFRFGQGFRQLEQGRKFPGEVSVHHQQPRVAQFVVHIDRAAHHLVIGLAQAVDFVVIYQHL